MQAQTQAKRSKEKILERTRKSEVISGSEILLRSLLLEGVECVFGYPGGAVLYIYDALHGFSDFDHLLARHEQGAIHAADGYARSTGKVGVCIATSGPGATNLVTGIATAFMDSVPLVVITGNVASDLIGTDAFQEADITGITMPITKHNYLVRNVADLPKIIHEAFYIANTGRKGPVLIDIPKDISAQKILFQPAAGAVSIRGYEPAKEGGSADIDRLVKAIGEAERPVILAGGGVVYSNAHHELLEVVERIQVPVTTTLLGLSGFPSAHDLWMGMPGMHGTYTANMALQNCDLLINIGSRFDDRVTMKLQGFAPCAQIAHIDVDPAEIGKNIKVDYPVVGDIKHVLADMNKKARAADSTRWIGQIRDWQKAYPLRYTDSDKELKPQWVISMISDSTQGEAIITTDVGQHQMWVAQFYKFHHPRSLITSGGLGTMGFGFPAAIGAQMGNPGRRVVSICGDGGMQMCSQELAVCAINNIPVKIAVINNRVLGMVRQWQEIIYDTRYSHIDLAGSPDFVKLADAYGVKGLKATSKEEAHRAWREALETPGPVLVEFVVSKEENVYPMVSPGNTIGEMLMGDEKQI